MAIPRTTSGGATGNNIALGDLTNLETSDTSVIDYNLVNEERIIANNHMFIHFGEGFCKS